MTKQALITAIQRLIIKRQISTDEKEIKEINKKLDKLYNLKYIMIEQENQY